MGLKEDLDTQVDAIFKSNWTDRDGTVVPDDNSVTPGNDAVKLKATVLYADMADSTILVDQHEPRFAAEIYKTFLICAAKIIRDQGGVITAYDGDRIMAVYLGSMKNTDAVTSALKINWAVKNIIRPKMAAQYPSKKYVPKHVVGIDMSELYVAKTGVRGANDLVWVGHAANYAAKLSSLPDTHQTYITKAVYDAMTKSAKFYKEKNMWESCTWTAFGNKQIYRSIWGWQIS
ncbi:adenylate/guanylate cyclase domain-containing protein [Roseiarcaceae bacterium H3SJ34-1]|uniref:adenylate/guanylate cyclase domain-containing protein n=1 Tax=Terripilifer ovatus TaxID=3032367 RepID=UPI003AB97113|nr:adenylate/guanylate cyclase domain-containing protein [Roseiarcaceae bacterium H3SJ34-1]